MSLKAGDRFDLVAAPTRRRATRSQVGVSYLGLPGDVAPGDVLLLDDGIVQLQVDAVEGERIVTTVLNDGVLSNRKGLNKQGGGLSLGALTERDRELIADRRRHAAWTSSRSRSAATPTTCTRRAGWRARHGSDAALVAKIERAEAIENLAEIVDASDVVMVARGDLGVEIGDAELPGLQKKIIREALAREQGGDHRHPDAAVDGRQPDPDPRRGAGRRQRGDRRHRRGDAVAGIRRRQLPGEARWRRWRGSASAPSASSRVDTDFEKARRGLERADQAIAMATMFLSEHIGVRAIVAMTESGGTARYLSRFRSSVPIYAFSRHANARRRMALMRDVFPMDYDSRGQTPREAARGSIRLLVEAGLLDAPATGWCSPAASTWKQQGRHQHPAPAGDRRRTGDATGLGSCSAVSRDPLRRSGRLASPERPVESRERPRLVWPAIMRGFHSASRAARHEHRTTRRNRPRDGRPGQGHHRDRRIHPPPARSASTASASTCTEENRRAYRELLLTAPNANQYLSGAILFDETIRQSTKDGVPFAKYMADNGMIPGIKVDKGTHAAGRLPGRAGHRGPGRPARTPGGVLQARRPLRQVACGHHHRRRHALRHLHRGQQPRAGPLRRAVPGAGPGADGRAGSADGRRPRHRAPATRSPKSSCARCSTRCTTRT